jgi:hypothetical protein
MNRGVLIIAHNSRSVDYARTAIISAGLAKKHLQVPVSLVTDTSTVNWMKESEIYSDATSVFEHIIEIDRPELTNYRILHDGELLDTVPFINSTRSSAYDLTPYDRTLLIDSDFLIMSPQLNAYWDTDDSVLVADSMSDIEGSRIGVLDKWISETGVHLYWATTVMFTKNEESKTFFQLVEFIKENYNYYADLYRFNSTQYRNDISFSIALHILNGFEKNTITLPPILTVQGKDSLKLIGADGSLKLLINNQENFYLTSVANRDVHIMNKQSLIRNYESLKGLL